MKFNLKPLSKLFSTFRRKSRPRPAVLAVAKSSTNPSLTSTTPKSPAPTPSQPATALAPAAPQTPATPPKSLLPRPNPSQLLDSIVSFLRQYLSADDHRLNLLALWIAHTCSFQSSPIAVYLDIRSPESHCGKSVCLSLLAMLSAEPWLASGPDPRTVVNRVVTEERRLNSGKLPEIHPPHTILLDNHHHTLGRSERQGLLAMLSSGYSASASYASGNAEYCLFGPKAFAGHGPLPRSLADRCVPIPLVRKRPSEVLARINSETIQIATRLSRQLREWAEEYSSALAQATRRPPANPPSKLDLAQQNNSEPLVHIADLVGGTWPQRIRTSLNTIYENVEPSVELMALDSVRALFFLKEDPPYLLTRDLLDCMKAQENRPWSGWPANAGRRLGALLGPFGICSRGLNFPDGKKLRGYVFEDFKDAWERYLPPLPWKSVKDMPPNRTIGQAKS